MNLYSVYSYTNVDVNYVDDIWKSGENGLIQSIDKFVQETTVLVDANAWSKIVQFAAQMFVRGIDFGSRFTSRLEKWGGQILERWGNSDNYNAARLIEYQRLTGVVMRCAWEVVKVPAGKRLIVPDLGPCAHGTTHRPMHSDTFFPYASMPLCL